MVNSALNGLVLAGGQSRRMGHDKALLLREGRSQLAFAVELLQEQLQDVFVSTRAGQGDESERKRYPQIVDAYDDLGPMAGILTALEAYPQKDWLGVAGGLPHQFG